MSSPATAVDPPELYVRLEDTVPVVSIPEHLDFEALRDWVRTQMPGHMRLVGGRSCRLDFGTRDIVLFDLRRLVSLLRQEFSVEVTGLYASHDAVERWAERELKLKLFTPGRRHESALPATEESPASPANDSLAGLTLPTDLTPEDLDDANATPQQELANTEARAVESPHELWSKNAESGQRSQTIYRTLRSGSSIHFDGDVIVFGDVNPGAQIVAGGNVVVLGSLKGEVHAGAAGDENAFVFALSNNPTLLRIARHIAKNTAPPSGVDTPHMATLSSGHVHLEPYRGRTPPQ